MESTDRNLAKAQQITRAVVNGQMGAVEAAFALLPILHQYPELASQDDRNFVVAVGSETDDLPLGPVRELWDANALIEKDREIARCDELWGDRFRATCERILSRLLPPS
jgi:hypothetical protein